MSKLPIHRTLDANYCEFEYDITPINLDM